MADGIKVWLDDERQMPDFYNCHVKTADEAVNLIIAGGVTHISLDHDLGTMKTGYDVAKYIEQHAYEGKYRFQVAIHTANVVGRENIKKAIINAMRYWMENERKTGDIISIDDSPSSWFTIMALCLDKKNYGGEHPKVQDGKLLVELRVNGKMISFVDAVSELYERLSLDINERAAKLAHEKTCEKFLKLEETLKNANDLVRNKIYEQFGIDVSKDDAVF